MTTAKKTNASAHEEIVNLASLMTQMLRVGRVILDPSLESGTLRTLRTQSGPDSDTVGTMGTPSLRDFETIETPKT